MTTTLTDAKLEKVFMDTLDKLYEIHALLDEDEVWFDSLAGVEQLEDTARKITRRPNGCSIFASRPRGAIWNFEDTGANLKTPSGNFAGTKCSSGWPRPRIWANSDGMVLLWSYQRCADSLGAVAAVSHYARRTPRSKELGQIVMGTLSDFRGAMSRAQAQRCIDRTTGTKPMSELETTEGPQVELSWLNIKHYAVLE